MLDDFDNLTRADEGGFLAQLWALPGSYEGPAKPQPEPYGLTGFGEASSLARALSSWVDAPIVVSGTQFLLAGGFDYGALPPLKVSCEAAGAKVVVLGYAAYEPELHVPRSILSPYTYASYLAHATGHAAALAQAERALTGMREQLGADIPTEENPAKALAWALWSRIPLFLVGRANPGLAELIQCVFARVGKTLSLITGDHPLEVLTGAFESRHEWGDDMVAVFVGPEDEELGLAREVLETRVAQIETLDAGEALEDPGARALALWYQSLWVAAYLALLYKRRPENSTVYESVSQAAQT